VSSQNTLINLFAAETLVGENTNKGGAPDICLFGGCVFTNHHLIFSASLLAIVE
jgi:hypothetical protein